jgi:GTPase Era involved in 16S rRNA processing
MISVLEVLVLQVPMDRLTDPDAVMASEPTLSTLAILASEVEASSSSTQKFDDPLFSDTPGLSVSGRTKEQMRKYYIRSLHKVVDQSDIILLVLDARDPEGCRSRLVEEEVRRRESEGKKLVFVLNKIGEFLKLPVYFSTHSLSNENVAQKIVRSDTTVECPAVAQASTTLNSNVTFFIFRLITPTHQHIIINRPFITQTTKSIQT